MKLKSILLSVCLAVLTCACSNDDFEIDGVNIIGTWAVFSPYDNMVGYIDCSLTENDIQCLYEFKTGGTYTYYGINYDDNCPRTFVDGYIDCERSHYDDTEDYLWDYRNGKLFISGFDTTVKKISDDEFTVTYEDFTYTLKRVKGFKTNSIDISDLIGRWAIIGTNNYTFTCNSSVDEIHSIYEFKSDGTFTNFKSSSYDDCSRKLSNGYIDCEESHYDKQGSYSWNYTNRFLNLDGRSTRIRKISDDEFFLTDNREVYKLERIRGFNPTNPDNIDDIKNLMGTWAIFSPYNSVYGLYGYIYCNLSADDIQSLYEFKTDGTYTYFGVNYDDNCPRTFADGYIDCEKSHYDNTENHLWKYMYGKLFISGLGTTIKEISDDEFAITYDGRTYSLKRVKGFKPTYDGSFNFKNVTAGVNYSFDAIVAGVCSRGIVVSNNVGNALIYDASTAWFNNYNVGTLIHVNATAKNYYGSLEFNNPSITVKNSSARLKCDWNWWKSESFNRWIASVKAVGSSATSGMVITQPIEFDATLRIKEDTYYYYVDGCDTPITMFFPSTSTRNAASTNGCVYHFKGYPSYYNASRNYLSIVVVDVY
jgi:hypothetical protein